MSASIPILTMRFLALVLLSAALAGNAALGQTNSHSTQPQTGVPADREAVKQKRLPYRGKLAAVDKNSRSFTVGKRTFYITAETKLSKNSQPVRLDQLVIGELVTGSYVKAAEGKLLAATVYVGGKSKGSSPK